MSVQHLCLCLPLAFFPIISSSATLFSIPPSLSTCPINLNCLPMMLFNNSLLVLAFSKTFSFDNFSTHCILNILLKNYIYAPSILLVMFLLIVQHSLPYVKTDHTYHFRTLFLVSMLSFFEHSTFLIPVNAIFAIPILHLMSVSDFPSDVMMLPKYVKLSNCLFSFSFTFSLQSGHFLLLTVKL